MPRFGLKTTSVACLVGGALAGASGVIGHRERAIHLVDQAIAETEAGIAFAR